MLTAAKTGEKKGMKERIKDKGNNHTDEKNKYNG